MSNILTGSDLSKDVKAAIADCKLMVTDSNLAALYPDCTAGAYVIPAGEKSKNPDVLFSIIAEMHNRHLQRGDCVAAFGGGVVGDITGLAAALYMRGVEWVNIPTSLLAMVDSSIGGKTAIDFNGIKNLVGAFHEPMRVIISTRFLDTLPQREWVCGAGELIKTCLLTADAYTELLQNVEALRSKEPNEVYSLLGICVKIKNAVVEADPTEKGLRKILNVGHTIGHALESLDNYRLSHGEYVIKGMMMELAMCKDMIDEHFYYETIAMLRVFSSVPRTTANAVYEKSLSDKKNIGSTITMMVPVEAGNIVEVKLEHDDFVQRYAAAQKELKSA